MVHFSGDKIMGYIKLHQLLVGNSEENIVRGSI